VRYKIGLKDTYFSLSILKDPFHQQQKKIGGEALPLFAARSGFFSKKLSFENKVNLRIVALAL
jgi:hypothetical protein